MSVTGILTLQLHNMENYHKHHTMRYYLWF